MWDIGICGIVVYRHFFVFVLDWCGVSCKQCNLHVASGTVCVAAASPEFLSPIAWMPD